MLNLKIGEKEFNIKFGYNITLKSKLISKMVEVGNEISQDNEMDTTENLLKIEEMMLFIPEVLLIGLQKNHRAEFGYNYDTKEGMEESLEKVCDLLDDYFEEEGADIIKLYNDLQNEMLNEGFLKNVFQKELAEQEKKNSKKAKKAEQS